MSVTKHDACIELKHVSYNYGDVTVLEDISFSIGHGEYLGIVGPNGGGKTTLLKILLGLLKPTTGEVKIFDKHLHKDSTLSHIGYIPQRIAHGEQFFPATAWEIIVTGLINRQDFFHTLSSQDKKDIQEAMDITGTAEFKNNLIGNLSGGQRQRVYIARALAGKPDILILDEPTTGVDEPSKEKFYEFLSEIHKKLNITIVFVSHDIDAIANEVQTLLCLNKRLIAHGSPKETLRKGELDELYGKHVSLVRHRH